MHAECLVGTSSNNDLILSAARVGADIDARDHLFVDSFEAFAWSCAIVGVDCSIGTGYESHARLAEGY